MGTPHGITIEENEYSMLYDEEFIIYEITGYFMI
jgi:hypothetical protein